MEFELPDQELVFQSSALSFPSLSRLPELPCQWFDRKQVVRTCQERRWWEQTLKDRTGWRRYQREAWHIEWRSWGTSLSGLHSRLVSAKCSAPIHNNQTIRHTEIFSCKNQTKFCLLKILNLSLQGFSPFIYHICQIHPVTQQGHFNSHMK